MQQSRAPPINRQLQTERVRMKNTVRVILWKVLGKKPQNRLPYFSRKTSIFRVGLGNADNRSALYEHKRSCDIYLSARQILWMLLCASRQFFFFISLNRGEIVPQRTVVVWYLTSKQMPLTSITVKKRLIFCCLYCTKDQKLCDLHRSHPFLRMFVVYAYNYEFL